MAPWETAQPIWRLSYNSYLAGQFLADFGPSQVLAKNKPFLYLLQLNYKCYQKVQFTIYWAKPFFGIKCARRKNVLLQCQKGLNLYLCFVMLLKCRYSYIRSPKKFNKTWNHLIRAFSLNWPLGQFSRKGAMYVCLFVCPLVVTISYSRGMETLSGRGFFYLNCLNKRTNKCIKYRHPGV